MTQDSSYNIFSIPDDSYLLLAFNLKRPHVSDLSLRKDICNVIDRNTMNTVFYNGDRLIPHSPVYLSTAYYYYKDIVKYNHSTTIVTDPTDTEESSFYSLYMILSLVFVGTSFGLRKKRRDRLSSP